MATHLDACVRLVTAFLSWEEMLQVMRRDSYAPTLPLHGSREEREAILAIRAACDAEGRPWWDGETMHNAGGR